MTKMPSKCIVKIHLNEDEWGSLMVEVRRIHPTSIFVVTFVLVQNVDHLSNEPQLPLNSIIQKELKKQLLLYQRKLFSISPPEAALVGQDMHWTNSTNCESHCKQLPIDQVRG